MLCVYCNREFYSVQSFLNHTSANHRYNDSFTCGYLPCKRKFTSLSSLRRHIAYCKKNSLPFCQVQNEQINVPNTNDSCVMPCNDVDVASQPEEDSIPQSTDPQNFDGNFDFEVMQFFTKLYNNKAVTRSLIQTVIADSSELLTSILNNIKDKLSPFLLQLNDEDNNEINKILSINPFASLNSEYKRFKYLEKNNYLIKPVPYLVGEMFDNKRSFRGTNLEIKKCKGQFIPIRHVLKMLLEIPNVYNEIIKYIEEETASIEISSLFNSSLWKSISKNYKNKQILPLLIYFDDYETGNPLGSHAGIHKLGAVYFSLACTPPKFAKQLSNIFLFGLFYSSDRTTFSNQAVFKPFIDELIYLQSTGISISVNNNTTQVYFVAPLILGDNLGMNSILGFNESFVSHYFCRICFADKALTQTLFTEDLNLLRNKTNYETHLQNKSHGVKEYCIWNDLPYYHCTTNACCDIMHDLFEGVCRYDMAKILKYLIFDQKFFNITTLNNRIKYFDFCGDLDTGNAVPLINTTHIEKGSIIMSSAEMYSFVTYFSLIVGDLVDESDDVWQFYLLLFNIIDIVTRNSYNEETLIYLQNVISEHNQMYVELFNSSVPPKYHFLIHYVTIIRNVGPLTHVSSIRFEAFHKVAKTNAHVVASRVNIPYTLAIKHQLVLSHRFVLKIGFSDIISIGPCIGTTDDLNIPSLRESLPCDTVVVKWLKKNGITYKPGIYFQTNQKTFDEETQLAIIKHVLYSSDEAIFVLYKLINTIGYDHHFAAYEIVAKEQNQYFLVNLLLSNIFPMQSHLSGNGNLYISLMNL